MADNQFTETGFIMGENWSGQFTVVAPAGGHFFYGALSYRRAGGAGGELRIFSRKEDMEQFIDFLDFDEPDDFDYDYE